MRLMGLIIEVKDFSEIPQFRVLKLKSCKKVGICKKSRLKYVWKACIGILVRPQK